MPHSKMIGKRMKIKYSDLRVLTSKYKCIITESCKALERRHRKEGTNVM